MTTPGSLRGYQFASRIATPALKLWLSHRARNGKEDAARLAERWGRPSAARPDGKLLWLHGVSVGESMALLSLAERTRATRPEVSILATTGTLAAAELMSRCLPSGAIHQYAPVDTPDAVRAFARHWRPDLGVFVESEIWPNLLFATKAGGARLALLSARVSASSARRWGRVPASARAVLGAFDVILARDEREAERLAGLGARIDGLIDLKFGAAGLISDPAVDKMFRDQWGDRPIILAASTHPGEDELVLAAFKQARNSGPAAVLIIAPRHPGRGPAIEDLARKIGFRVARRGAHEGPGEAAVFVADTIGEMGIWYGLADLALIGGSWVAGVGGHNPLEPARLGCPIVVGAHASGWPVYSELESREAAIVATPAGLAAIMRLSWSDPARLQQLAKSARAFVDGRDRLVVAGLDRTLTMLA